MVTYSFKTTEEQAERLKSLPNASEIIRRAIDKELGLFDEAIILSRISQADRDIAQHEGAVLHLKAQKSQDEALLRARTLQRQDSQEARLRHLETIRSLKNPEVWLESRVDVLAECGFKSAKEAMTYYKERMQR
jgi:hypothetical protein